MPSEKEKLMRRIYKGLSHGRFNGSLRITEIPDVVADFILDDRRRYLEEIEKAVHGIIEEAHDGIKDDWCYVHEIFGIIAKINELKGIICHSRKDGDL